MMMKGERLQPNVPPLERHRLNNHRQELQVHHPEVFVRHTFSNAERSPEDFVYFYLLVCCNIQFLTMVRGHCLVVGVRLAVPPRFGRAIEMKRVRQAVPLQPGRQSRWPIVKSQVSLLSAFCSLLCPYSLFPTACSLAPTVFPTLHGSPTQRGNSS